MTRFARRDSSGRFEFAPASLVVDGRVVVNPKVAQKLAAGWKFYADTPRPRTPPREGWHWEEDGWAETDAAFRKKWKPVRDPSPPPRVFVTADLVEALEEEGLWEQAKAWIVEHGKLDLVYTTKEFDENNENFKAGKAALQTALGWTDEEVEDLLARCVKEGV